MGNWNSGRRPTPNRLKVLRGNPSKRWLNPSEPQLPPPAPAFDEPPPALTGDEVAQAEWRRLAPLLRQSGMLSQAEANLLTALCEQWSRYREAHDKVREKGMIVRGPKDLPMTNPFIKVADLALRHCQRIWVELGLTPSSRSRISALPLADPQPVSKWKDAF